MRHLRGFSIGARDGDIGEADDFIFDDNNWTVRYLVADTHRWLPGRKLLISPIVVEKADWEGKRLPVLLTREEVLLHGQEANRLRPRVAALRAHRQEPRRAHRGGKRARARHDLQILPARESTDLRKGESPIPVKETKR
jgi:hypothetical protein